MSHGFGRALALLGGPGNDMARGQEAVQDIDRSLDALRRVEKFDDERQARQNVQEIGAVDFLGLAESGDAAKHGDAFHTMLIVQNSQDFAHQAFVTALVGLAQIDARYGDVSCHGLASRLHARRRHPQ